MPRLDDYDPEEKDKEPPLTAGGLGGGPSAPTISTPAPANYGVPTGQANFASYFGANQGAADATAGKLASGLEAAGQKVQSDLAGRKGTFQSGLDAGTPDWMKAPGVPAAPTGGALMGGGGGSASTAARSPRGTALQAPPVAAVGEANPFGGGNLASGSHNPLAGPVVSQDEATKRAGATYTGPKSLSEGAGWQDLVNAATKAQTRVGMTDRTASNPNAESGIQSLLQDQQKQAGNSAYGQGASRFDAGLTQAAGGDRFAALRGRFGGLSGQVAQADSDASQRAAGRAAGVASTSAAYQHEVDKAKDAATVANAPRVSQSVGAGGVAELGKTPFAPAEVGFPGSHIYADTPQGRFAANGGTEAIYQRMTPAEWDEFSKLSGKDNSIPSWLADWKRRHNIA